MLFRYLSLVLLIGAAVAWILIASPADQPASTAASSSHAHTANSTHPASTDSSLPNAAAGTRQHIHDHGHHALQSPSPEKIAALLEKHLTPAMRREINAMLSPPPEGHEVVMGKDGGSVEMGSTAASVMVAVIDDDGSTIVTDIDMPLNQQALEQP